MTLCFSVQESSVGGGMPAEYRLAGGSSVSRAEWMVRKGLSGLAPKADLREALASIDTAKDLVSSPDFRAVVADAFRSTGEVRFELSWDQEDDSEIRAIVIPTTLGVDAASDQLSALRRELRIADVRRILAGIAVCLDFAA